MRSQPSEQHPLGLLGHAPVAEHHGRVAQLELAVSTSTRVTRASLTWPSVGCWRGEPSVPYGRVPRRPDHPVGRLGHRVAAHDPQAEALLDLQLALAPAATGRCSTSRSGLSASSSRSGWRIRISSIAPIALNSVAPWRRAESRKRAGREAREQHEPGARGDRAEHGVGGRVDVEERQRGHQPVVGGQLHPPREALAGHRVGPVGLGHELRAPGRARGRDQHRRVVGPGGPGPVRRRASSASSARSTTSLGSSCSLSPSSSASLLLGLVATADRARGRPVASQVNRSPGRWARRPARGRPSRRPARRARRRRRRSAGAPARRCTCSSS